MWATAMEEWALDCQIECDLPDPIPAGYLHQGQDSWRCDTANQHPGAMFFSGLLRDLSSFFHLHLIEGERVRPLSQFLKIYGKS